jgi:hypothetical protein
LLSLKSIEFPRHILVFCAESNKANSEIYRENVFWAESTERSTVYFDTRIPHTNFDANFRQCTLWQHVTVVLFLHIMCVWKNYYYHLD